jgi:hypothetical protein
MGLLIETAVALQMRVISSTGHTYCVFISDSTSVTISAAIWNETNIYYSLA